MKLNYYIVNPGGNITAIVPGKFTKKLKLKINKIILENEPTIEQVGFWVAPKKIKAKARLEMAGGEFCGNALRSLGALVSLNQKNKKPFWLESSGIKTELKVTVSKNKSAFSMLIKDIRSLSDICTLPGISHIVTEEIFTKEGAKLLLEGNSLIDQKASGVISYKKERTIYKINPIVWVKATKTLYEETACASGTIALAYILYKKNGIKNLSIKQPSGVVFKTSIKNQIISLSGPIINVQKSRIEIKKD